ncbi:ABC transporter ATP-binding protein [Streptomyces sp. NPDC047108]|uniref:ABC transporter ATP-binding protein n=1 Tax=Streptomyces sp. NPDC047108 TaxID=3155025 RepID=UPI0033E82C87
MLTVEGLCAGYGGTKVLHGVDLTVRPGSVVALLGANGAGKSTTARAVAGLLPVTGGRVTLDGREIHRTAAHRRARAGVTLVPEGRGLFPGLSVSDNLRLGARRAHGDGSVEDSLERVFTLFPVLADRRAQAAGTMSGGQQQMLAVAKALMARPRHLILDEPSLGLAPRIVHSILTTLSTLASEGLGVLLIEQNAVQALQLADEAVVLERGTVTLTGPADRLADDERVRAGYLGGAV